MARNLSEGPIQIHSNDINSINDSLRMIQDRLDRAKGLHGRTQVWDRIRAEDPQEDQDVLTRGGFGIAARIVFLSWPSPWFVKPGTSFIEVGSPQTRRRFNFSAGTVSSARLIVHGWGTESGTKSITIFTEDGTTNIGFVEWTGTSEEFHIGELIVVDQSIDQYLRMGAAASSSTETLVLNQVILDLNI
jgi:hypothetical protein